MIVNPVWHNVGVACACLVTVGGDPSKVADRVAFIDKTPRIRVRRLLKAQGISYAGIDQSMTKEQTDWLNWAERPFKGEDGNDPASRKWCEEALKFFGAEFANADVLACVKCHSTKRVGYESCPECGGTEFKTWADMTATWGKVKQSGKET